MRAKVNNIVVVSDTHVGCQLAILPKEGARMDEGGWYKPNRLQSKLCDYWEEFWEGFVPETTKGEPYIVVHNGDMTDGVHHNSTTMWSQNPEDQCEAAAQLMEPRIKGAEAFYMVRGTEAHVGKSAYYEERLAKRLGAKPDKDGHYARWKLWMPFGSQDLIHFLHHVGSTGSTNYKHSALSKELAEMYTNAGRWQNKPPTILVRSHRHTCDWAGSPTGLRNSKHLTGTAEIFTTPCWQGKTPFAYKIPGARQGQPEFGGLVIRYHQSDDVTFVRPWVRTVEDRD